MVQHYWLQGTGGQGGYLASQTQNKKPKQITLPDGQFSDNLMCSEICCWYRTMSNQNCFFLMSNGTECLEYMLWIMEPHYVFTVYFLEA